MQAKNRSVDIKTVNGQEITKVLLKFLVLKEKTRKQQKKPGRQLLFRTFYHKVSLSEHLFAVFKTQH